MNILIAGQPVLALVLASVRIVAWLVVVPPFSSKAVPIAAKVVLSLGLAVTVAPAMAQSPVPVDTWGFVATSVTQAGIGLGMGFVTSLLFAAIAAAGSLLDLFGGFSLAQGYDPLGMNMTTVMGKFHQMLATVLLFVSGGHLLVIGGLLRTFELLPIGRAPEVAGAYQVLTRAFGVFFVTAVQVALPMVAVLFLADLGLALMTKVAPQLNAINVMFPAKIGLTLLLVGLSFPVLPGVVESLVELSLEATATLAGGG